MESWSGVPGSVLGGGRGPRPADAGGGEWRERLVELVGRGHAAAAELRRLRELMPAQLVRPSKAQARLLPDFAYFADSEAWEARLAASEEMEAADAALGESFAALLGRLYAVLHSVHGFPEELSRWAGELEEGGFLHHSLDSVLGRSDGRQLTAEALHVAAVQLIVAEEAFPGPLRERLLVAFYRHGFHRQELSGPARADVHKVCALFRSVEGEKLPWRGLLGRLSLPAALVDAVLGVLRTEDLYHQAAVWPQSGTSVELRSRALASQAAVLVLVLLFQPQLLHKRPDLMRELSDRFFPDNWVLNLYMGSLVNLIDLWEPFKAAKGALSLAALEPERLKATAQAHGKELEKLKPQLKRILAEGAQEADFYLAHLGKLTKVVRRGNVTLRWLLLHATWPGEAAAAGDSKRARQTRELAQRESGATEKSLLELLLLLSQLELSFSAGVKTCVAERSQRWDKARAKAATQLSSLRELLASSSALLGVEKSQGLENWLAQFVVKVEKLSFEDRDTGAELERLSRAVEEVGEFHGLGGNRGVEQLLDGARSELLRLRRLLELSEEAISRLAILTDAGYAWSLAPAAFTRLMQSGIRRQPNLAIQLQATFIKLSSALHSPLLRMEEAGSPDLLPVSQFYSRQLLNYVREVLQVVPATVFKLLGDMVKVDVPTLPARVPKEELKSLAALEERDQLAQLTHSISLLSEGLLGMGETRLGVLRVQASKLLQDGIRRELVKGLAHLLHDSLPSPSAKELSPALLSQHLGALAGQLASLRRSFVYVSDYISLPGLRLYQQDLHRVFRFSLELEVFRLKEPRAVVDWPEDSVYQSRLAPIPQLASSDPKCPTFLSRLLRQLTGLSEPGSTTFVSSLLTWYDARSKAERLGPELWKRVGESLGPVGVGCLESLCGERLCRETGEVVEALLGGSAPLGALEAGLGRLGQLAELRRALVGELGRLGQGRAAGLWEAVGAADGAVVRELRWGRAARPAPDNPLLFELSAFVGAVGQGGSRGALYAALEADKAPRLAGALERAEAGLGPRAVHDLRLGQLVRASKDPAPDPHIVRQGFHLLRSHLSSRQHSPHHKSS